MEVAFYLNIVSPHQMPLADEVTRRIGIENFRYVYAEEFHAERANMGWNADNLPSWCVKGDESSLELMEAGIVYTGIRCLDLLERRAALGKKTYYYSERWFKPIHCFPGWIRMLVPSYRRMAKRFVKWANTDPNACVLAVGPWAKKDFFQLGIHPDKIRDWGYFVAHSTHVSATRTPMQSNSRTILKVLYIGRLIPLKCVDTIIRAVARLPEATLTIVGDGPEKSRLQRLSNKLLGKRIEFRPFVPIEKVREVMRRHDVLVFASNALDGWGAVVSEALDEGVPVVGTRETGASAALLPETNLFSCGNDRELAEKLRHFAVVDLPYGYTPSGAAELLLS